MESCETRESISLTNANIPVRLEDLIGTIPKDNIKSNDNTVTPKSSTNCLWNLQSSKNSSQCSCSTAGGAVASNEVDLDENIAEVLKPSVSLQIPSTCSKAETNIDVAIDRSELKAKLCQEDRIDIDFMQGIIEQMEIGKLASLQCLNDCMSRTEKDSNADEQVMKQYEEDVPMMNVISELKEMRNQSLDEIVALNERRTAGECKILTTTPFENSFAILVPGCKAESNQNVWMTTQESNLKQESDNDSEYSCSTYCADEESDEHLCGSEADLIGDVDLISGNIESNENLATTNSTTECSCNIQSSKNGSQRLTPSACVVVASNEVHTSESVADVLNPSISSHIPRVFTKAEASAADINFQCFMSTHEPLKTALEQVNGSMDINGLETTKRHNKILKMKWKAATLCLKNQQLKNETNTVQKVQIPKDHIGTNLGGIDAKVYTQLPEVCLEANSIVAVDKLQRFMEEHAELKTTLDKVNGTMEKLCLETNQCHDEMSRVKLEIATLCNENQQLTHEDRAEVDSLRGAIEKMEKEQLASHQCFNDFITETMNVRIEHEQMMKKLEAKDLQMMTDILELKQIQKQILDEIAALNGTHNAEERINRVPTNASQQKPTNLDRSPAFKKKHTEKEKILARVKQLRQVEQEEEEDEKEHVQEGPKMNIDQSPSFKKKQAQKVVILARVEQMRQQEHEEQQQQQQQQKPKQTQKQQQQQQQLLPVNTMNDDPFRSEANFTYTIHNIDQLKSDYFSPPFYVSMLSWRIRVKPIDGSLGFFLCCNSEAKSTSWSCNADCKVRLKCYKSNGPSRSYKFGGTLLFNAKDNAWGWMFIKLTELLDPKNGFVKDNSITLEGNLKAEAPRG